MQSMIDFFASRDWNAIIDGVFQWGAIAILSTLCIIFRKTIGTLCRSLFNHLFIAIKRARRLRYKQILPDHTLEHLRLRRKLRATEKELQTLKQARAEQDKELKEALNSLLKWAADQEFFTKDQLLLAMHWDISYTDFIFNLACESGFIQSPGNHVYGTPVYYFITTAGQKRIFRAGLLCAQK